MPELSSHSALAGNPIEEENRLAEKLEISGKKIIRINQGNPPMFFPTPRYIIDAYVRALRSGTTGYSYPGGIRDLRKAVAARHRRLYNLKTDEDHIIVTQGISEAIIFLNDIFIDPGDRAVLLRPYYPIYQTCLAARGGVPIYGDYTEEDGYRIDTDAIRKELKSHTSRKIKFMIFANPSNPTGYVTPRSQLKELVGIANDHNLFIISDEIYDEIVYNGAKFTSISEVSGGVPTAILGGASKNYDATGFRLGYAIVPEDDKLSVAVRDRLYKYAEMRLSSNTPAQYAFMEGLNNVRAHSTAVKGMVKEIEKRANFAYSFANDTRHLTASRPNGAFYMLPKVDMKGLKFKNDQELVRKLLIEEGVQISRGSGFGAPGHIRLVVLAPQDILELAIRKIDKFLIRHSK